MCTFGFRYEESHFYVHSTTFYLPSSLLLFSPLFPLPSPSLPPSLPLPPSRIPLFPRPDPPSLPLPSSLPQLVQSELVADNCAMRCAELGIPFFRFSPRLRESVSSGETNTSKLVNMILQTRLQMQSSCSRMGDLMECFQKIADNYRARRGALYHDDLISSEASSPGINSTCSGMHSVQRCTCVHAVPYTNTYMCTSTVST